MNLKPSDHQCHIPGCGVAVPPELLMCPAHWRYVPTPIKALVWKHYRVGQCDDKRPSREWFDAADAAIKAVVDRQARMRR